MTPFKYVVVEGPLGVGKTTLAHQLAQTFGARLFLEQADRNPFLGKFYENPRQFAFQTQLFFLLERYRHQEELRQLPLFSQGTVSDYLFAKDRIFAYVNLTEAEFALYDQLYRLLIPKVLTPDLVIYLQAESPVLLERIRLRGRPYEQLMSEDYLKRLNQAYNDFFFYYRETPLLVVNTTHIDFVKNPQDYEDLLVQIKGMGVGTKYYVPDAR